MYTFKQSIYRRSLKWHEVELYDSRALNYLNKYIAVPCLLMSGIWMNFERWDLLDLQDILEPPAGPSGTFDISCSIYQVHWTCSPFAALIRTTDCSGRGGFHLKRRKAYPYKIGWFFKKCPNGPITSPPSFPFGPNLFAHASSKRCKFICTEVYIKPVGQPLQA